MQSLFNYKYENLQQADKLYFNNNLLNDEDKEFVLNITNGDKYTSLVSALVYTFKKHGDYKQYSNTFLKFYNNLKNYNKGLFPLPIDMFSFLKKNDKYDILRLRSILNERKRLIDYYKQLPSIAKRNLKINKSYDNKYQIESVIRKVRSIIEFLDVLKGKIDNDKFEDVLKKIFTSKNDIDQVIMNLESFIDAYINLQDVDEDTILNFCEYYDIPFYKYSNNIITVIIQNQEQMEEIAGTTLWCFARPGADNDWDIYTNSGEDLPILIYNFNYAKNDANFLTLYLTKDDSYFNANNIEIHNVSYIDVDTVDALENTLKKMYVFENGKINEKIDTHYEYGCLMAYVKPFKQIDIDDNDIYDNEENQFGIETEPHVTLLYGLHDDDINEQFIIDLFRMINIDDIGFENISLFEKDDYSVVKYDIISKDLEVLNEMCCKIFPYTNEYDYHPHLTIAYVKPGMGVKYINQLKYKKLKFDSFVYSMANGRKIRINKDGVEVLKETE